MIVTFFDVFREVWAMDSGRLSFQLCEAKIEEHRIPDQVIEPCCACEEAKYEVTFEGLWSEKTHPKDFPKSRWLLHFSDIIGASHSAGYRCVSNSNTNEYPIPITNAKKCLKLVAAHVAIRVGH